MSYFRTIWFYPFLSFFNAQQCRPSRLMAREFIVMPRLAGGTEGRIDRPAHGTADAEQNKSGVRGQKQSQPLSLRGARPAETSDTQK